MENLRIKKVIAREGLILISILLFSGVFLLLNMWANNQKKAFESYKMNAEGYELLIEKENKKEKLIPLHIVWLFPKNTKDAILNKVMNRELSNIEKKIPKKIIKTHYLIQLVCWDNVDNSEITASYNSVGKRIFTNGLYKMNFFYIFILSLCLYPAYLLIKFVMWAIKVLRLS
jgi:hypothetical protein